MRIRKQPGETREQFIARVVSYGGPPTPAQAERLRQLIPMPPISRAPHSKAA